MPAMASDKVSPPRLIDDVSNEQQLTRVPQTNTPPITTQDGRVLHCVCKSDCGSPACPMKRTITIAMNALRDEDADVTKKHETMKPATKGDEVNNEKRKEKTTATDTANYMKPGYYSIAPTSPTTSSINIDNEKATTTSPSANNKCLRRLEKRKTRIILFVVAMGLAIIGAGVLAWALLKEAKGGRDAFEAAVASASATATATATAIATTTA